MSALENAVQSLINGGYGERQAREILSLVCGEAREAGYNRGAATARTEALTDFADRLARKAEAMGAVWLRVDQVCDALRRVAAEPATSEVAS
ncbi:hypothetical protein OHR86_27810 [Streptomyces sp. NBC_00441]|uniref:hypothetical protein n=1 Tax=Streptomyces sp. NBC_00441 TaxID=2975742 RepID=UPI002E282E1A|nr:hypothetical protein [Streptomyces sp. NBC_00441]